MTLHIEMVSDVVCPWCWVGLRRMQAAIQRAPELKVDLLYRPFELDPSLPAGGADYKDYMKQRFGSDTARQRANQMRDLLVQYGKEDGIPFDFEAISWRPNTFNAHRLIRWAQGQKLGRQAKEALFEAYFARGQNIGDTEVLVTLAAKMGLDANIISDLLTSEADVVPLRDEQARFRQMGVQGVPTFIAHRQIAIQGAETPEKYVRFLKTAAAQIPTDRPLEGAQD